MVDNVTAGSVPPAVAEPLFAQVTHNHTIGLVDATVLASVVG